MSAVNSDCKHKLVAIIFDKSHKLYYCECRDKHHSACHAKGKSTEYLVDAIDAFENLHGHTPRRSFQMQADIENKKDDWDLPF